MRREPQLASSRAKIVGTSRVTHGAGSYCVDAGHLQAAELVAVSREACERPLDRSRGKLSGLVDAFAQTRNRRSFHDRNERARLSGGTFDLSDEE